MSQDEQEEFLIFAPQNNAKPRLETRNISVSCPSFKNSGGSIFSSLGLDNWIVANLEKMGIRHPTLVQNECIPAVLQNKDVLACSETGSGKTAAFTLPIIHELSKDPYGIYAVVLTPTRY